ncbi:SNF2-related protein [Methanobrevibacter sp.]|uniref:SNF2-related protein n=1 Tax=Methanobrevibacter sp. TaxID=66852 RepID=UPI00388E611F
MARRQFTKTWWGEKWLDALEGVYWTNRIGRGRSYANTGRVYDVEIHENTVTAKVKGNYRKYYDVMVEFKKFTDKQKEKILRIIYKNPSILSALLNHKLPIELHDMLKKAKINVFPTSHHDMYSSCNCPDYALICKHIAGLVHMIALEIDKDPFLIFKLQGFDLLESLNYSAEDKTINITSVDDLFMHEDVEAKQSGDVDFSKIPELHDKIFLLLNDNPVFFKKNFKAILNNIYKSMARFVKRHVDDYTRYQNGTGYEFFYPLDYEYERFRGNADDYDGFLENVFLERWGMPNQWNSFKININGNYDISKIRIDKKTPFDDDKSWEALFGFFTELSQSQIDKFCHDIQFLNMVYNFSLELIKKHAIVPELFETKDKFQIRWIPAIFDNSISDLIDILSSQCPDNLVKFKNRRISAKDQIITLISLFVEGFFQDYLKYGAPTTVRNLYSDSIVELFFFNGKKLDINTAESVNQWLSKFSLSSRDYDLYLVVEQNLNSFNVDVKVNDELTPINEMIEKAEDNTLRLNLLKDTYIINEIFPDFNRTIDLGENLEYNLDDFTNFFMNTLPLFELMGIKIILPKSLQKIFKPKLVLDIKSKNEESYIRFDDLTKFDWKVAIGNTTCSLDEFKKLSEKSKGLVRIANEFVMLDERQVKSLLKQIDKLPEKLSRHDLMKALLSGEINDADVNIDGDLEKLISEITSFGQVSVSENVCADLRPYQKTGYSWLVQNISSGFGSILADDMGLGKTLQVLTAIQHLKDSGMIEKQKVLVIAPTSLLTNWAEEISRFTPDLTSFIYHGSNRKFPKKEYDVYLTSYGVIRRDVEKFKRRKWFLIVVDEAQNIKNPDTKQTKAVKSIKSKHKIAMSGTPVENRLAEYWSIFDFINKGYLKSLKNFRKNYISPIEKERNADVLDNFKKITQPFILRRLKTDKSIIFDLPDKIVNDVYCNLTGQQIALYKETLDASIEEIEASDGIKRRGIVLKLINSLKQICNHPSQFTKSKSHLVSESGKLEVLMHTLQNILDNNEKVLIFTQYVQMGEIIQDRIEKTFKQEVLFLHGSLSRKKRDDMVKKFQNNPQNKIFIVSLKAGGTGLNLTAAQNVIHYDLWWNPAVENQATDRAYRIGQSENVMVYRFICKGTFEEKINEMINKKQELAQLTVGDGEKFITEMTNEELKEMLTLR